jgi:pyruvate kinase
MKQKTRIVATLGPATCSESSLRKLIAAGMSIARLNASHNSLEWHRDVIRRLRNLSHLIPILIDIPGRKIRTGLLPEPVPLVLGQTLVFTTEQNYSKFDKIPVTYANLHNELSVGDVILADDGSLRFKVLRLEGHNISCSIETSGLLGCSKGLNIPYIKLKTPVMSERDRIVLDFAMKENVDFVGISFVESSAHVNEIKAYLGKSNISVIAKIENNFGLLNSKEIIIATDAVMIDRGDLAAETQLETIAIMQKEILREANKYSKPVILATEMLSSMVHSSTPTKAEITDISNGIIDGAAAIMLSGETAVGSYPLEAVAMMKKIALAVEKDIEKFRLRTFEAGAPSIPNAIGRSVYELCVNLPITKVICLTATGFAPKFISKFPISQPIVAVTDSIEVARKVALYRGVESVVLDLKFTAHSCEHIIYALEILYKRDIVSENDIIVAVAAKYPKPGNKMNTLEIYEVKDLMASQNWSRLSNPRLAPQFEPTGYDLERNACET